MQRNHFNEEFFQQVEKIQTITKHFIKHDLSRQSPSEWSLMANCYQAVTQFLAALQELPTSDIELSLKFRKLEQVLESFIQKIGSNGILLQNSLTLAMEQTKKHYDEKFSQRIENIRNVSTQYFKYELPGQSRSRWSFSINYHQEVSQLLVEIAGLTSCNKKSSLKLDHLDQLLEPFLQDTAPKGGVHFQTALKEAVEIRITHCDVPLVTTYTEGRENDFDKIVTDVTDILEKYINHQLEGQKQGLFAKFLVSNKEIIDLKEKIESLRMDNIPIANKLIKLEMLLDPFIDKDQSKGGKNLQKALEDANIRSRILIPSEYLPKWVR